jgi:hypothetical protein
MVVKINILDNTIKDKKQFADYITNLTSENIEIELSINDKPVTLINSNGLKQIDFENTFGGNIADKYLSRKKKTIKKRKLMNNGKKYTRYKR